MWSQPACTTTTTTTGTAQNVESPLFIIGLMILEGLVQQMNQVLPKRTMTQVCLFWAPLHIFASPHLFEFHRLPNPVNQHRKTSVSFRDVALHKIFQCALFQLLHYKDNPAHMSVVHQVCICPVRL